VSVVQRFHQDARLRRNGVDYIFCNDGGRGHPRPRTWSAALHRMAAGIGPDVVHVNGLSFPLQTWLLRRALPSSTAIVVQDHASGAPALAARGTAPSAFDHAHRARRWMHRRAMQAADAFFFTAASQADPWRAAGFIGPHQRVYQVAEASTVMQPVCRGLERRDRKVDGDPAVLWVGRLNANKDPLAVVDAFERALAALPDAVLTMVYSADDLLTAVRDRVGRSDALSRRVRLIGRVPHSQMAALYSRADIFVLGSHHEGSGYALVEACACGLSPVVTDIPAFDVITGGGAIGALWTPGDVDGCARALHIVARRDRWASRERVLEHFERALGWPAVARQALEAYREVSHRRHSERAARTISPGAP
jgi:glycosyltransferase involved in cell wall biosynthesis